LAAKVTSLPAPPPNDPPLADTAPDKLVAFLYYMTRDLIPPRYTQGVLAHIEAFPNEVGNDPDLRAFAERMARRIMYDRTSNGSSG
jgi:hypothetical protein